MTKKQAARVCHDTFKEYLKEQEQLWSNAGKDIHRGKDSIDFINTINPVLHFISWLDK